METIKPYVFPLDTLRDLRPLYDWAFGSVGYESRSRFFYQQTSVNANHREVFLFKKQQVLAFDENRKSFERSGFREIAIFSDPGLDSAEVKKMLQRIAEDAGKRGATSVSLIIDISSMNRQLISLLCLGLSEMAAHLKSDVHCDFVYCLAKFGELPELNGPIVSNGPVIGRLAGWCRTPGAPCGLVLGIGYEEDLALGIIEELEAGAVWAFRPMNQDPRYDAAINDHNRGLFETIPSSRLIRYSPRDPYALFIALDQLAALSKGDYRLLVVPFGPKIFALAGCLVGISNFPEVGIWRVSAGPNLKPVDREVEGSPIGLRVAFLQPEGIST